MQVGFFKKRSSGAKTSSADLAAIREFVASRQGVEAYLEPKTSVTQTTVVFVARDGEPMRKPFESPKAAADFARKNGIPLYDANLVGYPQRMRDYNLRQVNKKTRVPKAAPKPKAPVPSRWTREQLSAIRELQYIAEAEVTDGNLDEESLSKLIRTARAKAHPDRNGGDRSSWDRIDAIARLVDLH